jgi:acetyl-CoA synthetase
MKFSFNMDDYEKAKESFRIKVPENFNYGFDVVDDFAKDRTKLAMVWMDAPGRDVRKYSFRDVSCLSNKVVNALKGIGVKKGDRVFIMLPRIPEWYFIMVGCHKLGAVVMPATVMLTRYDIEYRLVKGKADIVITSASHYSKVEEACHATGCPILKQKILVGGKAEGWLSFEEIMSGASVHLARQDVEAASCTDPFLIYFTSGTTKYPKMVLHNCSYPLGHLGTAALWHDAKSTDLIWVLSDTGWAKAAWGFYAQWIMGAAIFVHNAEGKFNPKLTLKLLSTQGITVFCAPPTVYAMLILEDLSEYDFSSLRRITSAGEPLNPGLIKAWHEATGMVIGDGYGQTETTAVVANYPCLPVKPGSMGKPVPDLTVEIVDENCNPLPTGEIGIIAVRVKPEKPVGIFEQYVDDEEENDKVFKGEWYLTGDKAYKDNDGYFYFFGRADDVIKSSGYRIGPFEVESVLQEHEAVAESAVVGSPDPVRGEIIKAFIILTPGYEPSKELVQNIQEFVKSKTAPYKYPREIEFVDELPKTISGKIKRSVLKRMETERKLGKGG